MSVDLPLNQSGERADRIAVQDRVKAVVQVAGLHSMVRIDPYNESLGKWFRSVSLFSHVQVFYDAIELTLQVESGVSAKRPPLTGRRPITTKNR